MVYIFPLWCAARSEQVLEPRQFGSKHHLPGIYNPVFSDCTSQRLNLRQFKGLLRKFAVVTIWSLNPGHHGCTLGIHCTDLGIWI